MDEALDPKWARDWFVSYDVTARQIILQRSGEDPHEVTVDEAMAVRRDLLAAVVAANEHVALDDDDPAHIGRSDV